MPEPEEPLTHHTSLAVWDVTSPAVIGRRVTLKAGVACPSGCDLTGTRIDVYNESGTRVGGGYLGSECWPGTIALRWVELTVAAPAVEGAHSWRFQTSGPDPSHSQVMSAVRVIAVRPPEHQVTFEVMEKSSGAPLAGVELRVGAFSAATSDTGRARVEVPGGTYEVCAWKIGYELLSSSIHVGGDTTIHLEVAATPQPEQPYWM